MKFSRGLLGITATMLASAAAATPAPVPAPECAVMDSLLRQARTDFPSLRQRKVEPGQCSLRNSEFKCAWEFAGDRFDESDAQAARLVRCVAAYPTTQRVKAKGKDAAFAVDPDLTVLIPAPELGSDGWTVTLVIRTAYKQQ